MFPDWKFPHPLSLLSILTSCLSRLSERLPDFFLAFSPTGRTHAMLGKGGVKYTVPVRNALSPRDYKGDREGIPHIHPIPKVIRLELFLESG